MALTEAAELARRGHDVELIAGFGEPDDDLLTAGVRVWCTGQQSTRGNPNPLAAATQGIWNVPAQRLVRSALRRADSSDTVVHLHGFVKVLSASVVRAVVEARVPAVATLHDYFAACPNGGFFNYHTNEICHLSPLSRRCVATHCDIRSYPEKLWRVGRSAVQKHLGAMPSGIRHFVSPSAAAGEILRPYLPSGARLHVVPNAVPMARQPAVDPAANRAFLFVGRLDRDKGPVLLAQAARRAGVPVVFVGSGPEEDAVRRANAEAEVTGWLPPERVDARLRLARAVVNTSLWYETYGLTSLEAAAHGIPAVISDVTVLRDVVEDGVTGLWFGGGDVDDLADKLLALDRDDALVRRLGGEAYRRFWEADLDLATHVDRLEAVYGEALLGQARRSDEPPGER